MPLANRTIAIIGAGNMGGAILRGLLEAAVDPGRIIVTTRRSARAESLARSSGVRWAATNAEAVADADLVVLAVKPQIMEAVVDELAQPLQDRLSVSVAAGTHLTQLEAWIGAPARVIRAMPNMATTIGEAATALARGTYATEEDLEAAVALFDSVGRTVVVEEEHMDAVTGLSGSGPAYVFLILEAFADAGVKVGLSREVAQNLATQTLKGAALLLQQTGDHPGKLKDSVTSPGGTAIAGLHVLEAGGLRTTIMDAVEAATIRARQLGGNQR